MLPTVGDSYMCIGGLPVRNPSDPVDTPSKWCSLHWIGPAATCRWSGKILTKDKREVDMYLVQGVSSRLAARRYNVYFRKNPREAFQSNRGTLSGTDISVA